MRFLLFLSMILISSFGESGIGGTWKMYPSLDQVTLQQYMHYILDGYLTFHHDSESFMVNGLFIPLNGDLCNNTLVSFSVSWNNGLTDLNQLSSYTGLHNCTTDNIFLDFVIVTLSKNTTQHLNFTKGTCLMFRIN